MKLSIIIPAYNEEKTLEAVIRKVDAVKLDGIDKEIVIVDDCSSDSTPKVMAGLNTIGLTFWMIVMGLILFSDVWKLIR